MWRSDIAATVQVIDTKSIRMCAIPVATDSYRFLMMNVYMPYEGNDSMTSEFADQLLVKNNIILNNSNYYVIAGSDFNVDIFRPRGHIATLSSFRFNSDPSFFKKREMSDRQFLLVWYDSFHCLLLLSGVLYNTSINGASATHNTDTLSDDHKTIALYD
jgi:hypothetical protein